MSIYYSKVHRANTNTRSLEATIPREIVGYLELKEGDTLRWESLELEYEKSELGEKGEGTIRVRATAIIEGKEKCKRSLRRQRTRYYICLSAILQQGQRLLPSAVMVKTVRRDSRAPMDRLGEDKGKLRKA